MSNTISKFFRSYTFKFMVIGILSLILLIPTAMIRELIRERQARNESVMTEISERWSLEQFVTGPFLSVPVGKITDRDRRVVRQSDILQLLPDQLAISGTIEPLHKQRGIFTAVVYEAGIQLEGYFKLDTEAVKALMKGRSYTDRLFLTIGLSDLRGVGNGSECLINGKPAEIQPGTYNTDIVQKGIHVQIDPSEIGEDNRIGFSIRLDLKGSFSIHFEPVGKETEVSLTSPWSDPSFTGNFLPAEKTVSEEGFEATWKINYLNRNYPQQWLDDDHAASGSSFGVHFLVPVDHYQKSERSVKYAFMFIALTFLVFFLTEVITKKRIHPIQYLLVGFALVIFYTLLVSLSEHVGFNAAYLLSTAAITLMVGLYIRSGTSSVKVGVLTGLLLLALYIYLFSVLQLQELSLLMGSIGLFLVLGIIMYVSRKINWYREDTAE